MEHESYYRGLLETLTPTEQKVLALRCENKKYQEIADELVVSKKDVEFHLGNIYQKLHLGDISSSNQRKTELKKFFCPLLMVIINLNPPKPQPAIIEIGDQEETPGAMPENTGIRIRGESSIIVPEERTLMMVNEDEPKDITNQRPVQPGRSSGPPENGETVTYVPKQPFWRRSIPWFLLIVATGFISYLLWGRFNSTPAISTNPTSITPTGVSTNTPTETLVKTNAPIVVLPTDTPVPTNTITNTPTLTLTPLPTSTPVPTFTPLPIIALPFTDNFDQGLNPDWQIITGKPKVTNGALSSFSDDLWMYLIIPPDLKNYAIEYDVVLRARCGASSLTVIPIFVDTNNYLGFIDPGNCFQAWTVVENGKDNPQEAKFPPAIGFGNYHAKLTVNNGTVEFFVDNQSIGTYLNFFPQGEIGLKIKNDARIDDFKVNALP